MPKTRTEKEKIVKDLVDRLNKVKSVIFTGYKGLTATEVQKLREKLREKDIEYKAVKLTLFRIAQAKSNLKDIKLPEIKKPLALAFGLKDEVLPAKIIKEFSKEHKALEILGGILDERFLTKEETEALALLPTREELLAKIVYIFKTPVYSFVDVLEGTARNLICVLQAITGK